MTPSHHRFGTTESHGSVAEPTTPRTPTAPRRPRARWAAIALVPALLALPAIDAGAAPLSAQRSTARLTKVADRVATNSATAACTVSAKLVPSCGAWWGVSPGGGGNAGVGVRDFEAKTNARTDFFHGYHRIGQMFPTPDEIAISRDSSGERLLYLSLMPIVNGGTWAQVARGSQDAYLDRLANHIEANYPGKFFMSIHHEPENDVRPNPGSGMEATDFADMFRHVVLRLRAKGANNIVFVTNFQGTQKFHTEPWWPKMWPGDDVVDWFGWDSYSCVKPGNDECNDYGDIMNRRFSDNTPWPGMYEYAMKNHSNKPFFIGELGVYDTGDSRKANFFRTAVSIAPRYPNVKAVAYWDSGTARRSFLTKGTDAATAAGTFARSALFSQQSP